MLTRLSRAFLRVFPAILLVVVGLIAALFRRRGGPRKGASTLVSVPARRTVPPVRRRGAAIALLALLVGIALILALAVDGPIRRLASPLSSPDGEGRRPVAALSQPKVETGRAKGSEAVAAGGSAVRAEPGGATAPGALDTNSPSFDTVRVEPNGDLVVAGRATPNGTVEFLVDGKPTARVVADANGQFAIVPPALPAGNSEVVLRMTDGKGGARQSRDSVVVVVSPSRDAKPLVALSSPDKPTVVLSQPGSSQTATRSVPEAKPPGQTIAGTGSPTRQGFGTTVPGDGASSASAANDASRSSRTEADGNTGTGASDQVTSNGVVAGSAGAPQASSPKGAVLDEAKEASTKIVSVDAQEGGRLFVTGQAAVGATVRLYLNDTLIAPARVGRDGSVSFTIGRGVKAGDYKVRLDQVDASGKVRSRVEVPFSVPEVARIAGTDNPVGAPSETAPNVDGSEKAASDASRPMASSPDTVLRQGQVAGLSDGQRDSNSIQPPGSASTEIGRNPSRSVADPAVVFVPEVRTARIERGDSLWAISRRTYGDGDRYTAIYDANQNQIRDPDLIYPGQVFVLPSEDAVDAVRDEKRG
jgi:nucleoid-associated protein YgaU